MFPKDDRFEPAAFETPDYSELPAVDTADEWRAAPFSHFLGLSTISHKPAKSRLVPFDDKVSFGFKLLSSNPTPLSSLLGLPLLKANKPNKTTSFGLPLLTKPRG